MTVGIICVDSSFTNISRGLTTTCLSCSHLMAWSPSLGLEEEVGCYQYLLCLCPVFSYYCSHEFSMTISACGSPGLDQRSHARQGEAW